MHIVPGVVVTARVIQLVKYSIAYIQGCLLGDLEVSRVFSGVTGIVSNERRLVMVMELVPCPDKP